MPDHDLPPATAASRLRYLGGLTSIAIASVVIGVMGDIVVARGMQPSLAQLVVGLGIVAAGVVSLLQERARA